MFARYVEWVILHNNPFSICEAEKKVLRQPRAHHGPRDNTQVCHGPHTSAFSFYGLRVSYHFHPVARTGNHFLPGARAYVYPVIRACGPSLSQSQGRIIPLLIWSTDAGLILVPTLKLSSSPLVLHSNFDGLVLPGVLPPPMILAPSLVQSDTLVLFSLSTYVDSPSLLVFLSFSALPSPLTPSSSPALPPVSPPTARLCEMVPSDSALAFWSCSRVWLSVSSAYNYF